MFIRLAGDLLGLARVGGVGLALRYGLRLAQSARECWRQRSLGPADQRMGPGPFVVRHGRRRFSLAHLPGGEACSLIRQIWVRDEYLGGGFLSIPEGALVLDLGASVGSFTLLALAHAPSARVIAVEPDERALAVLRSNLAANGLEDRVAISRAFLGEITASQRWLLQRPECRDAPLWSARDVLKHHPFEKADLIKCDIEGSEFALFADGVLLGLAAQLAIELHHDAGPPEEFEALLRRSGFETRIVRRAWAGRSVCPTPSITILLARRNAGAVAQASCLPLSCRLEACATPGGQERPPQIGRSSSLRPPASSLQTVATDATAAVSTVILTLNEEQNLPFALESVKGWSADVHIVDCGSTDRTLEIARAFGARIHHHAWKDWAAQRNWALGHCPLQHEWVLFLDADEQLTPHSRAEIAARTAAAGPDDSKGFHLRFDFYFLGQPLRGVMPPHLRLVRRGAASWTCSGSKEYCSLPANSPSIHAKLIHWDRRGLGHWLQKMNHNTTLEARRFLDELRGSAPSSPSADSRARRVVWNWCARWMPPCLRVMLFFVYRLLFRMDVRDGWTGLVYTLLYGFWRPVLIEMKVLELRREERKES